MTESTMTESTVPELLEKIERMRVELKRNSRFRRKRDAKDREAQKRRAQNWKRLVDARDGARRAADGIFSLYQSTSERLRKAEDALLRGESDWPVTIGELCDCLETFPAGRNLLRELELCKVVKSECKKLHQENQQYRSKLRIQPEWSTETPAVDGWYWLRRWTRVELCCVVGKTVYYPDHDDPSRLLSVPLEKLSGGSWMRVQKPDM